MSLITLGLSLDYKTEGGLAATDPITVSSRPFFWQQMERTRANFVTLEDLALIKHARVTLTDAQVKALPTTPITLIAAPAAGLKIKVISAALRINKTAAYTNLNASYCAIALYWLGDFSQWAATGVADDSLASLTRLTSLITGTGICSIDIGPYTDNFGQNWVVPAVVASTITDAKALAIAADNNGSGAFTGGNSSNTLRVDVAYMVI